MLLERTFMLNFQASLFGCLNKENMIVDIRFIDAIKETIELASRKELRRLFVTLFVTQL